MASDESARDLARSLAEQLRSANARASRQALRADAELALVKADLAERDAKIAHLEARVARMFEEIMSAEYLTRFAEWVVALDEPGNGDRPTVTIDRIIGRAHEALGHGPADGQC